MNTLFPTIKPYKYHELAVCKPHLLYLEETGNPEGIPVIVLHPGPGNGADGYLRRFFDPERYRIILFDQRGCGRSTPHTHTDLNTTEQMIEDIEAIRDYLQLSHMVLWGGGWGCLLALLYAQRYPHYIKALLLHGIFLGRQSETDWFYKQGASLVFPDYWQDFIQIAPEDKRDNLIQYYYECLQGSNELARMGAAKNWSLWQARCYSLQPHQIVLEHYHDPHFALALATIETHYLKHQFFIEKNQILENAHKIRHIPAHLLHGRYDMICPLASAWDLHQALPASNLTIVRDAGHSNREAGMIEALIAASQDICRHESSAG